MTCAESCPVFAGSRDIISTRKESLMATAAQILANRANAACSTGPRTAQGKARSARNALKHGLTAAQLVVREDERDDFEALRAGLRAELAPQGAVEILVFNDLLHAAWNLHRYRRIEAEHAGEALVPGQDLDRRDLLDRLARYQSRAQRAFYRALGQLRKLQTDRALRALKLTEEEDVTVPAIADINELTKQTQSEVIATALELALKMIDYEAGIFQLQNLRRRSSSGSRRPSHLDTAAAAPPSTLNN